MLENDRKLMMTNSKKKKKCGLSETTQLTYFTAQLSLYIKACTNNERQKKRVRVPPAINGGQLLAAPFPAWPGAPLFNNQDTQD
jgi:hypothetical protein